jgi:small-conductance mechanosensitive channel
MDKLEPLIFVTLHIVLIIVAAWILKAVANKGIRNFRIYISNQTKSEEEKKRLETLGRVFRYAATVSIVLLAGMLVLTELGISIAPILAAAGVLGLAVGFGAQSLVKDYFSGLFLLLEDQIRYGDVIEVAGKSGLVEEVTLRYVKLRSYDGNIHFVPNGRIDTVTNMSREYSYAVIDIGVAYKENLDQVFSLIESVGYQLRADEEYKHAILDNLELAGVEEWADSSVMIKMRIKVAPLQQWGIKRALLHKLKIAFDLQEIEIPFPHLTVYAPVIKNIQNDLNNYEVAR